MIQKARLKNLEHFGFGPNVMKKTKICSQCGRVAKANSSYCSKCSERLPPETLFDCYKKQHTCCPNCDTVLAPGSQYCPNCGEQILLKAAGNEKGGVSD